MRNVMERDTAYIRTTTTIAFCVLCIACIGQAVSGETTIRAGVEYELVAQDVEPENLATINSNNQIISPFAGLVYSAKLIDINAQASLDNVERRLDGVQIRDNYTTFNASSVLHLIRNRLTFTSSSQQSYRPESVQSLFVEDALLNAENLVKTRNSSAVISLNLPTRDYFGVVSSLRLSKRNSTPDIENSTIRKIDSTGKQGSLLLLSGMSMEPLNFKLNASYNKTDREQRNSFVSESASATINTPIFSELSFTLLGSFENNDIGSSLNSVNTLRKFHSVGAGFTWSKSSNRFIEIAYNRYRTEAQLEDEEDEEDNFLSATVNWQFSTRTALNANFSRRFFGESASISFSHSLRTWRNSLNYVESVTTPSNLSVSETTGLFVCDSGSTDLSDCNLSPSLEPELAPGQTIIPGTIPVFEYSDNVVINKSLSFNTSLQRRRTKLIANIARSENQFVESDGTTQALSLQLSAILDISNRSSLSLSVTGIRTKLEDTVSIDDETDSTILRTVLSYNRKLSRKLDASLSFNYLDRDGELNGTGTIEVGGIQGPLVDKRIVANVRYTLSNR